MRRLAVAGCLLAFVAGACGGEDGEDVAADRSPPAATTSAPTATPCAVQNGSQDAQRSENMPPTSPLTDVRYNDEGCPQVAFEFRDDQPGYVIEYASPPFTECGSGEPVPTEGWGASAFLRVRLEPSGTADLSQESAPQTYEGRRDIEVDGTVLKRLRVICDFDAVLEWVVGLDARHDFRVLTLDSPSRILIEISES